jgi:hypothetical protein
VVKLKPDNSHLASFLRTTCSPDEICISDSVAEIGEKFPHRSLQLVVQTTEEPKFSFAKRRRCCFVLGRQQVSPIDVTDLAEIEFAGRTIFALNDTKEKIGIVTFRAVITLHLQMTDLDKMTGVFSCKNVKTC